MGKTERGKVGVVVAAAIASALAVVVCVGVGVTMMLARGQRCAVPGSTRVASAQEPTNVDFAKTAFKEISNGSKHAAHLVCWQPFLSNLLKDLEKSKSVDSGTRWSIVMYNYLPIETFRKAYRESFVKGFSEKAKGSFEAFEVWGEEPAEDGTTRVVAMSAGGKLSLPIVEQDGLRYIGGIAFSASSSDQASEVTE